MIKVVDFGFAARLSDGKALRTPVFTLPYGAPEVLRQLSDGDPGSVSGQAETTGYSPACDIWSLGVILVSTVTVRFMLSTGLMCS